jgi:predicted LPLAT superfamily acyltransferase
VSRAAWATVAERGSMVGMRFTVGFYRLCGRWLTGWLMLPIVAYFFWTDARGRRASRRYLETLHAFPGGAEAVGGPPTWRHSFRHYREFGRVILDRVRFALGASDVELVFRGREHLTALIAARRGAVLLGAHLGSFDALRLLAARTGVTVNVLMITRHAPRINAVLERLNPDARVRVIESDLGNPDAVFHLKACVERGEFVAILGDRVAAGARARVVRVPFLGQPAAFPQGPFLLAHALQSPIVLMIALRRGPTMYEIFAEPLAERVALPRAERMEALRVLVKRYAERLQAYCLSAPFQWFNFFDFWGDER